MTQIDPVISMEFIYESLLYVKCSNRQFDGYVPLRDEVKRIKNLIGW
ncbi:MAG: hypothetical protein ACYC1M_10790 [Armatimonadota bacterium]